MTKYVTDRIEVRVTAYDGPVPVFRVAPVGRGRELWLVQAEDGGWRCLWRVKGVPARLPARPEAGGFPPLGEIVARAFPELVQ